MDEASFEDQLADFAPEQVIEARAILDELADTAEALAMVEAHRVELLARLGQLADAQATGSSNVHAPEYARRSLAAQAGIATREHPASARTQMTLAERIRDDCPASLEAMQAGKISLKHAEQVVRAGANLDAGARASLDNGAVAFAQTRTPGELRRILTKQAADLAPSTLRERHAQARAERRIAIVDFDDGMSEVSVIAPTFEARAIHDRLSQMARHIKTDRSRARSAFHREHGYLPEDGWTAPVSGGVDGTDPDMVEATDRRTMNQIRVDLMIDLLLGSAPNAHELHASGSGASLADVRATVQVTIPVAQLRDPDRGTAWFDDGTPIPPDTARIVAGNTTGWERIFIRPDDGTIAAVDRYRPTTAQRRALVARDVTCRLPGCTVPATKCDVDHSRDHAQGGTTTLDNLAHLCAAHHQMKHQAGWKIRQVGGGVIELTTPTGRVVTDEPISRVFFQDSPGDADREQRDLKREHADADGERVAAEWAENSRAARAAHSPTPAPMIADGAYGEAMSTALETGDDRGFGWTPEEFLSGLANGTIVDPEAEHAAASRGR